MPTPRTELKNNSWYVPLIKTSQDKSTPRLGVAPGKVYELLGVDGTVHGGMRPLTGFTEVLELDWFDNAGHDYTSRVLDWEPTSFRIGAEEYGYGTVYKASRRLTPRTDPPAIRASYTGEVGFAPGTGTASAITVSDVVVENGDTLVCAAGVGDYGRATTALWIQDTQTFEAVAEENQGNYTNLRTFILKNPAVGTNSVRVSFDKGIGHACVIIHVIKNVDHANPVSEAANFFELNRPAPAVTIWSEQVNELAIVHWFTNHNNINNHVPFSPAGLTEAEQVTEDTGRFMLSAHEMDTVDLGNFAVQATLTGHTGVEDTWCCAMVLRYPNAVAGIKRAGGVPGVSSFFQGKFTALDAYGPIVSLASGEVGDDGYVHDRVPVVAVGDTHIVICFSVGFATVDDQTPYIDSIVRDGQSFTKLDDAHGT
jgi:hypothetical protein